MKVLHLDIETAPNVAHVWALWDQNVSLNQLIVPSYILCFAAKWEGERAVYFERVSHDKDGIVFPASRRAMLEAVHKLLSEADAVVGYNSDRFDLPKLRGAFLSEGMTPPAPFRSIDLYPTAKRLGYPSSKLQFVAQALGVGQKVKHEGHELWKKCMADDPAAWEHMERYNKGDVRLQERVYRKMLPWIANHPNRALYVDDRDPCCPACGSKHITRNGTRKTLLQTYRRFVCQKCGAWSRGNEKLSEPVPRRGS